MRLSFSPKMIVCAVLLSGLQQASAAQSTDSPGFQKYREHIQSSIQEAHDKTLNTRQKNGRVSDERSAATNIRSRLQSVPRFSEMVAHPHRPHHILVRFKSAQTRKDSLSSLGYRHVEALDHVPGLHRLRIPADVDLEHALEQLNANPRVSYAEPDYRLMSASVPNDPHLEAQSAWWLGQIRAHAAWRFNTDARGIGPIAVFDDGVEFSHEDLVDNLWTNVAEIIGNGIDDDGNGYVDDIHGLVLAPFARQEHGTKVAGTLCATGNNNIGVTGIAWKCDLMIMKTVHTEETQTVSAIVEGLGYAIEMGSRISNHSQVIQTYSQALADAVDSAQAQGHLMICAAGNSARNIDVNAVYPAALPNDNIIAVSATDVNEQRWDYSNYGPESVDIAAPSDFTTTAVSNTYEGFAGTSQATPVVTAAVALAWSARPEMTYAQIRSHVLSHVRSSSHWANLVSTGGILDMQAIMETLNPDTDGDGIRNDADSDDDNDGVPDSDDAFPLNTSESVDSDSDGTGDNADTDDDNDNVADAHDWAPLDSSEQYDIDGDGVGNHLDSDDDGDGIADSDDIDSDNDGIPDSVEGALTLDERVQAALSVSSANYSDASSGDWVSVTKSEYQKLANDLEGATRFGTPERLIKTDPGSFSFWSNATMWTTGHGSNPTPANVHVYGFMRPTGEAVTGGNDFVRLSNSSVGYRYAPIGSALPDSRIDGGAEYFLLKGADSFHFQFPQYLGLSTDQNSLVNLVWNDVYIAPGSVSTLSLVYEGSSIQGLATAINEHRALIDFDNDGLPDRFDIDSDNDGIADIVEAGGTDVDGNGLVDDVADQGGLTAPPDSDADGLPDFSDSESSNAANDGTGWDIGGTAYAGFDSDGDGKISSDDRNGGVDDDSDGVDDLIDPDPTEFGLGVGSDPAGMPEIRISDISVQESIGKAKATLTLSQASNSTVAVTTFTRRIAGSATPGQDYYGQTIVVNFLPGQTTQTIEMRVLNDTTPEDTEQFEIRLNGAYGANLIDEVATVTILDDDIGSGDVPSLSVLDQTVSEGALTAAIEINLSEPATSEVTVTAFTRAVGSAAPGSDFYGASQSLVFAAGETRSFLNLTILDDDDVEGTETFEVRLINASGAQIERSRATISLLDHEIISNTPPLFSVSSQTFDESVGTAEVIVKLRPAMTEPVSVRASTRLNGTATGGQDLYGTSQRLVFEPGETQKIFSITIIDDTEPEDTETFEVKLGDAGGIDTTGSGYMQLIDDDSRPLPVITMDAATVSEGDGIATVTISLTYAADVVVDTYTRAATATAGSDFYGKSKTLQFSKSGPTTQTVEVDIVDDSDSESTEYLYLKMLLPRGATREREQVQITIFDND